MSWVGLYIKEVNSVYRIDLEDSVLISFNYASSFLLFKNREQRQQLPYSPVMFFLNPV